MLLVQNIIRNARLFKDDPATIMDGRKHNWRQFTDRVARAAAALQGLGISEGDRVGILALNSDRYVEALFAIQWAGAVMVPKNIRWSLEENAYSAKDSGLAALIADDTFRDMAIHVHDRMAEECDGDVKLVHICDGEPADGFDSWDDLIEKHAPVVAADRPYDSLAGIYYTGGTTGFPKGVMLSHQALWSSAMSSAVETGLERRTVYLHAAPMFHLADTAISNLTTCVGGAHTFVGAFTPAGTLRAIAETRATAAVLVPTMIAMLLDDPAFAEADTSSLSTLFYGASPMPEPVLRQALELLPQTRFVQGYGQTEMAPLVSLLLHEFHALDGPNSKLRSAGRPISCVQVRVVDEEGNDCERGKPGEIWAKGPNAMDGYWNKPEQTAETLVNGWVKTGDIAYEDEDGFLFICDRAKDMIVTGGENVFSAAVENAVLSHPSVAEVAVIGIPDEKFGERVHAVIVPVAGAKEITQDDIYAHCKKTIAGYKCPRSIEMRDEPLPLSGAGKVLKKDLRAPYWEGRDSGVA